MTKSVFPRIYFPEPDLFCRNRLRILYFRIFTFCDRKNVIFYCARIKFLVIWRRDFLFLTVSQRSEDFSVSVETVAYFFDFPLLRRKEIEILFGCWTRLETVETALKEYLSHDGQQEREPHRALAGQMREFSPRAGWFWEADGLCLIAVQRKSCAFAPEKFSWRWKFVLSLSHRTC